MIATLFHTPIPSTQFTLKNPKPPNSISPNASNYFLKNPTFTPQNPNSTNTNTNTNTNNKDDQNDTKIEEKSMLRMPTAPWMKGPLLVDPNEAVDASKPDSRKKVSNFDHCKADKSLTHKVSGRMGKKALKKLVQSIENLQVEHDVAAQKNWDGALKNRDSALKNWDGTLKNSDSTLENRDSALKNWDGAHENKYGTLKTLNKWDVTQKSWGDNKKNVDGAFKSWGGDQKNRGGTREKWGDLGGGILRGEGEVEKLGENKKMMPWERSEMKMVFRRMKKEKVVTLAELSLDKELYERLREEGSKMRKWVKVKKLGVTQGVVDEAHSVWANNELVMFKFDLPLCRNMDRAREIVEIKTGGLVVWSRKDSLVAYRGCDYHLRRRFRKTNKKSTRKQAIVSIANQQNLESNTTSTRQNEDNNPISSGIFMDRNLWNNLIDRSLYEREGDRLLDGLGPRFIDWWYPKPLPVDGDLLPEVVPGFTPPFRLCPPDARPQLRDDELTYLRSFARQLPVHFVLGRNSKLQGLAVAILKLWERSVIAKMAVKWGVQNTNNELMASELKRLTGGILILRNKFFIILYRGKDFLPNNVANMVFETETELKQWQLHEEDARIKAQGILDSSDRISTDTSMIGTLAEYEHIQTICYNEHWTTSEAEVKIEAEKARLKKDLKSQEHKLGILKYKISKADKELTKLKFAWQSSEEEPDQELLTEEERECFRMMGLKMGKVLVLGRRGIFDGVMEGLHQHWKHRELVKVITMQKKFLQVVYTARFLERESGGVLVSIDKLKEGHAIIIYRGKNYRRPVNYGDNLLDKRKALKRSLEMQRRGSLNFFAYQREKEIADLRLKLAKLEKNGNESF